MSDGGERSQSAHCAGIFLISLATLLLELALTRVLSVALWYHFGFLVISTALLGFGSSGVVLAVGSNLRERVALDRTLTWLCLSFGAVTIASFWLMQQIPFDPFSLFTDRRQLLFMPLYYFTIAAPFFCSGLVISLLLSRRPLQVSKLYAFDLLGAGVGCAALALVMPHFGGSGSVVVAAAFGMLAAAVFGHKQTPRLAIVSLVLAAGALCLALVADKALPIRVTTNKTAFPHPPIYQEWNTFSLIQVFDFPAGGRVNRPNPERVFFFDAGTAATGLRPDTAKLLAEASDDTEFESGVAYVGKQHPKILIIGSGAGAQVLDGLHYGASSITAVEINPIINDVVSHRMRDYWAPVFERPEVQLVTEEGRSFVRRSHEKYDAIISVHTISNAAVASGALSLAENYVLTREAFTDYLDHLTPDGVIFFTRPETQIARLFATAREVFMERGLGNPAAHLFAYRYPPSSNLEKANRKSFFAGFLLKKTPFSAEDILTMRARLGVGRAPDAFGEKAAEILYAPSAPDSGSIYHALLKASDIGNVYRASPTQLAPATDDRPFFNQHTRWSRLNFATIRDLFSQEKLGRLALEDRPVAEVTLLILLLQSIVIAAVLILWPLARFARAGLTTPHRWRFLIYFAGLGLGFIMIEIALLQRYTLFLGQPVYTLAVVLASLLIFTGLGAGWSARFAATPRKLGLIVPLILLLLALTAFLTPPIFAATLGWALPWRVALAVLTLAPLGILLGMPFPTGLRLVADEATALIPWVWGVNGFFTVIGTVSALILGMVFGFRIVLLIAGLCYLLALAALIRMPAAGRA